MVELRLKGKNITVKNSHVNDDELTHLVNGIKDLKYL